jgi:hypothetical protein
MASLRIRALILVALPHLLLHINALKTVASANYRSILVLPKENRRHAQPLEFSGIRSVPKQI